MRAVPLHIQQTDTVECLKHILELKCRMKSNNLEIRCHLPAPHVGVVDDDHLLTGLNGPQSPFLARSVGILKLVGVEVVVTYINKIERVTKYF